MISRAGLAVQHFTDTCGSRSWLRINPPASPHCLSGDSAGRVRSGVIRTLREGSYEYLSRVISLRFRFL